MISVIVPVYNVENYLRPCLESLRAQTFCDFEALVVDDGSTDGSGTIIDEFVRADSRFRKISRINGGLSVARNTGIDYAAGDWLVFLDGDDMLFPDALRTMLSVAVGSDADVACFGWECGLEPGSGNIAGSAVRIKSALEAASDVLYRHDGMEPSACAKIFRRCLFDDMRFTEGIGYEDVDLIYRVLLEAGSVAVTDRKVYFYRQRPDSFMHVWQPRRLDILGVVDGIERYCGDNCPRLLTAARDRKFAAYFNIFMLAVKNGMDDVASQCWPVIRRYRRGSLFASRSRMKNRVGALVSYGGKRLTALIARFI